MQPKAVRAWFKKPLTLSSDKSEDNDNLCD